MRIRNIAPPLLFLTCLLIGCTNETEKGASKLLQKADSLSQKHLFNEARIELDSIKILYPKATDERKKAITALLQIDLKEQQVSLHYYDSLLIQKKQQAAELKPQFVLEKDANYQSIGYYFTPQQAILKNQLVTSLTAQTDELGQFSLVSTYCGTGSLDHHSIKIQLPDGTFLNTLPTRTVHKTNVNGVVIEKATFQSSTLQGLPEFIISNSTNRITLILIGKREIALHISQVEIQAIQQTVDFAHVLATIIELNRSIQDAKTKILFFQKRIEAIL